MSYSGNPTVKQFKTDMLAVSNALKGSLEDTYLRQADELMQNMRGSVPVESGTLKASIRKRNVTRHYQASYRVSIQVLAGGPTTTHRSANGQIYDHALGIEFGTVHNKAEPFFYPTARRYAQGSRTSAAETVDKAIEENNRVRALRSQSYSNAGFSVNVGGRGGATVL